MDKKHIIILILMSWIFFFNALGGYSLKEPDEGRYAEIPREMLESGDFVVPRLNYVRYFEKPPLFYWTVAGFYKLFGINQWSFRLPCALSAFFCAMVIYIFTKRWFGEITAFYSTAILISSFGFFSMARIVTLDMFFTLWLTCSIVFFYEFYRKKRPYFIYLFYVFLALATLTKGIVVPILVGLTVFIFLITEKRLSFLKEIKLIKGIFVYLVVTAPWFIAISLKEREFFYFFFIDQHFLRFLTPKHKRTGSIFYFIPVLFGGLFPWSFFIPRAVKSLWMIKELRLFFIWSTVVFLFFTISSSKLPPYILPIFPAISIVMGFLFSKNGGHPVRKKWEILLYLVFFIIIIFVSFNLNTDVFYKWASLISKTAPAVMIELKVFFILVAILSAVVSFFMIIYFKSLDYRKIFILLTCFSLSFVTVLLSQRDIIDRLNTTKGIANIINAKRSKDDLIINYGSFDQTLLFYTRQRLFIASYRGELDFEARYEDAKDYFISDGEFVNILNSEKRVFCVVKEKRLNHIREKLFKNIYAIECLEERCVFTNMQ
ncbi:MAG TPA: glycosyltransferase family 39 protein [Syntrophorhabdaceae bacterium]|nr:glycosyltransferase family 39 protein [Syntrophorhabdaceae bacterium]